MTDPSISTKAVEQIANAFHDAYEQLAPRFGYETREASRKAWTEIPENNRRLMMATVEELIRSGELVPASEVEAIERSADYWNRRFIGCTAERNELRAERDRMRKERDALMDDRLEAQRDELLQAIAEHEVESKRDESYEDRALYEKAEKIRAGESGGDEG